MSKGQSLYLSHIYFTVHKNRLISFDVKELLPCKAVKSSHYINMHVSIFVQKR
jgi:hypothetical protein